MTPKEIKIRLIEQGITQADIAQSLGVTRTSVHNAIYGVIKSKRIMEAVVKATEGIRPIRKEMPMWYGDINVEAFIEDLRATDVKEMMNYGGPQAVVRDHVAKETMLLYQREGVDPIDLLQSVLDKLRADAQIVVNQLPAEVAR